MNAFYSILVHVVTHADIQASLLLRDRDNTRTVLARPHFSRYGPVCAQLLAAVEQAPANSLIDIKLPSSRFGGQVSIGVSFRNQCGPVSVASDWRIRSRDVEFEADKDTPVTVTGVFLPLLALLLPYWLHLLGSVSPSVNTVPRKHYIYLLSGSHLPRTPPYDTMGNSTANLARLIEWFTNRNYSSGTSLADGIVARVVDSGSGGLFSFDRNVQFVQKVLVPLLATKRREVAHFMGEEWPKRFSLMLSLKNDTVARTAALMASLRQFRPDFLHVSEAQSFWYGYPNLEQLWDGDVEFLSFESVEHSPATPVAQLDQNFQRLVEEMVRHKLEFEQAMRRDHEQRAFWLRKTNKPVLSVLMVQKEGCPPSFFTGINIEVSMPTGSLCAERNAIGTCLSSDPSIHRKDMVAMAVLSMSIPGQESPRRLLDSDAGPTSMASPRQSLGNPNVNDGDRRRFTCRRTRSQSMANGDPIPDAERAQNPINPCGACKEWLKKIAICNPDFRVLTFRGMHCDQVYVRPVLT